ncbi:MAG: nicotinamide-nucleotide adenylyltransferase [Candidatus Heimdallarchaeota archaeon]|nr:nicotinamide-nucleotide adenylyltransferase [Candidatus Heimdallarchaeota archaeon]
MSLNVFSLQRHKLIQIALQKKIMNRGLFIGRFQPPHLGHLKVIQEILKEVDELVIIIAAAQSSMSVKNPFTAGERLMMTRSMLKNANVDMSRIWLLPVQDIYDNDIWVAHTLRMIPPINVFFSNNPFTTLLFTRAGIEVRATKLQNRSLYEARQIRELLAEGGDITMMVDSSVLDLLTKIQASERLQTVMGTDSKKFDDATSNITR